MQFLNREYKDEMGKSDPGEWGFGKGKLRRSESEREGRIRRKNTLGTRLG